MAAKEVKFSADARTRMLAGIDVRIVAGRGPVFSQPVRTGA